MRVSGAAWRPGCSCLGVFDDFEARELALVPVPEDGGGGADHDCLDGQGPAEGRR